MWIGVFNRFAIEFENLTQSAREPRNVAGPKSIVKIADRDFDHAGPHRLDMQRCHASVGSSRCWPCDRKREHSTL
jgi:hypothetical protein